MNFRLVFKLTGKTLLVEAGALLLPLLAPDILRLEGVDILPIK